MPENGLLNTDKRVLSSLMALLADRDQAYCPITYAELSSHALVSLRTVPSSLGRLRELGLIAIIGARRGVPGLYSITEAGATIVEEELHQWRAMLSLQANC